MFIRIGCLVLNYGINKMFLSSDIIAKVIGIVPQILCTASVLSYFTSTTTKFNVEELYGKIKDSDEYKQFMDDNKDKSGQEVTEIFIKNTMYQIFDEYATIILDDKDLNDIFELEKLSDEDKLKVFTAKSLIKITELSGEHFPSDNEGAQELILSLSDELINLVGNDIHSGYEYYHRLIDVITCTIMEKYNILDVLNMDNEDNIHDKCTSMIDEFNNVINYKSKYENTHKRKREDDDNKKDDEDKGSNKGSNKKPKK